MKSVLKTFALLVIAMPVFAVGEMDNTMPSTTDMVDCTKAVDQAACHTALDNCMKMTGTAQTACMDKMKSDMGMSDGHDMSNGNGVTTTVQ